MTIKINEMEYETLLGLAIQYRIAVYVENTSFDGNMTCRLYAPKSRLAALVERMK
jgi:hypothetical protein